MTPDGRVVCANQPYFTRSYMHWGAKGEIFFGGARFKRDHCEPGTGELLPEFVSKITRLRDPQNFNVLRKASTLYDHHFDSGTTANNHIDMESLTLQYSRMEVDRVTLFEYARPINGIASFKREYPVRYDRATMNPGFGEGWPCCPHGERVHQIPTPCCSISTLYYNDFGYHDGAIELGELKNAKHTNYLAHHFGDAAQCGPYLYPEVRELGRIVRCLRTMQLLDVVLEYLSKRTAVALMSSMWAFSCPVHAPENYITVAPERGGTAVKALRINHYLWKRYDQKISYVFPALRVAMLTYMLNNFIWAHCENVKIVGDAETLLERAIHKADKDMRGKATLIHAATDPVVFGSYKATARLHDGARGRGRYAESWKFIMRLCTVPAEVAYEMIARDPFLPHYWGKHRSALLVGIFVEECIAVTHRYHLRDRRWVLCAYPSTAYYIQARFGTWPIAETWDHPHCAMCAMSLVMSREHWKEIAKWANANSVPAGVLTEALLWPDDADKENDERWATAEQGIQPWQDSGNDTDEQEEAGDDEIPELEHPDEVLAQSPTIHPIDLTCDEDEEEASQARGDGSETEDDNSMRDAP